MAEGGGQGTHLIGMCQQRIGERRCRSDKHVQSLVESKYVQIIRLD